MRDYGAELAIITNGPGGCVAAWENNVNWFPAYKPAKTVDSTGAGDLFHAGLLHGILKNWDVADCVSWAAATAALSLGGFGGRGFLPDVLEVEQFLKSI